MYAMYVMCPMYVMYIMYTMYVMYVMYVVIYFMCVMYVIGCIHYTTNHCTTFRCTKLHYISLRCIVLHCFALRCIILHNIALHYIRCKRTYIYACMHACMHACIHITQNRQDDIWVCMNMGDRLKQQFSLRKLRYAVTFGLQYFQTIHFCSAHYIVQLTSSISTCWTHSTLWMGSVCVCVSVCAYLLAGLVSLGCHSFLAMAISTFDLFSGHVPAPREIPNFTVATRAVHSWWKFSVLIVQIWPWDGFFDTFKYWTVPIPPLWMDQKKVNSLEKHLMGLPINQPKIPFGYLI